MPHDPHKDDPLWLDFYNTQGPGVHDPHETQAPSAHPPSTHPSWEDRLDTYLGRVWLVCISVLGYIGLVVLAIMLATLVVGLFNG